MQKRVDASKVLAIVPEVMRVAAREVIPEGQAATVIRKGLMRDVEKLEPGSRTAIQLISTRDIDRDQEILDPEGAILEPFRQAPQVLWGHDYSQPPIGSDVWVRLSEDGRGLVAKTRYASTKRGKEIFRLKQEGHLKTQSVGFVPVEVVENAGPGWGETIKRLGAKWKKRTEHFENVKRIHTRWLLLEHSDVSVPSNINALQLAVSKGLDISDEMLTELGVDAARPEKARRIILQVRGPETRDEKIKRILAEAIACERGQV